MPFLVLLFVMAWMDRVNIGFAKLQLVKDLGFSEAVCGFGAGIFYLGYLVFEIPSNLFLERIRAQDLPRITILWGITGITTMLVKTFADPNGMIYHRTVTSLLTVCLTLGDNPDSKSDLIAFGCDTNTRRSVTLVQTKGITWRQRQPYQRIRMAGRRS